MLPETKSKPYVVLETGSFLTLLLGGEKYQSGYAYAQLLHSMASKKLVHLVVPDMVMMEILGVQAPVYEKDLIGESAIITPHNIPKGFSHGAERLKFFQELLQKGVCSIERTECGDEYLNRIQGILVSNGYREKSQEEMRHDLLKPTGKWVKAVKNSTLKDASGNVTSSGKQDRGELAVADAMSHIHAREGLGTPVFALYEGFDVRARIIQRMLSEKGSSAYHQLSGDALDEFNPSSPHFSADIAPLGTLNFLSTKGFLAGMMHAARYTKNHHMKQFNWSIVHPLEAQSTETLNHAYDDIVTNINEKGLSRVYTKYRDVSISEISHGNEDAYLAKRTAPWLEYIATLSQNPQKKLTLNHLVYDYIKYRDTSLLADASTRLEQITQNISKMSAPARAILATQLEQMQRHLSQDEKNQGR